jgi:hypothetical protein
MLTKKDQQLIEAARAAIESRYRDEWQEVGAALRTKDGRIVTGVNIDAYLGRMAVCAEAVAIGRLITEVGNTEIDTIVAVPQARGKEPLGRGRIALRLLPRIDPRLCAAGTRDRAERKDADGGVDRQAAAEQV